MISVITPTLNEAITLPQRASELNEQEGPWEWIVVDGDSEDDTPRVAKELGARVLCAPRGRGTQLNVGAEAADGDILLFLHADTSLPTGALHAVRRAVWHQDAVGGNFALRFDGDPGFCAILSAQAYLRQKFTGVYFGDSAIFARRDIFETIGGFPDQPLLEDFEFSRRLESYGKTRRLKLPVRTSGRRFEGRKLSTLFTWGAIHLLYRAGVSADDLSKFYARGRT